MRRPRSIATSSALSSFFAVAEAFSFWKPRTAVVTSSSSFGENRKSGIFSFSSHPRARSRSKRRVLSSFARNQSWRVCARCTKPKSRRWTAFDPSSVSSVPIGLASSKPGIWWQREAAVVRDELLADVDLLRREVHLREVRLRVEDRLRGHLEVEGDAFERRGIRLRQRHRLERGGRLQRREVLGDVERVLVREPEVRHLRVGIPGLGVQDPAVDPVPGRLRSDAREVRPELPVRADEVALRVGIDDVAAVAAAAREELLAARRVAVARRGLGTSRASTSP